MFIIEIFKRRAINLMPQKHIIKISIMAIEDKSLIAFFFTIIIEFIFRRNYCIKSYARHKGIILEDKWLK